MSLYQKGQKRGPCSTSALPLPRTKSFTITCVVRRSFFVFPDYVETAPLCHLPACRWWGVDQALQLDVSVVSASSLCACPCAGLL